MMMTSRSDSSSSSHVHRCREKKLTNMRAAGSDKNIILRAPRVQQLAQQVQLRPLQPGVYEVVQLGLTFRIVVANQLPQEPHNAMLLLFSSREELQLYGQRHLQLYSNETSTLILTVCAWIAQEPSTSDKVKEFARQYLEDYFKSLPVEKRMEGISPEERLKGLPPGERLKGLSTDEQLRALSPEAKEELARRLKMNGTQPQ